MWGVPGGTECGAARLWGYRACSRGREAPDAPALPGFGRVCGVRRVREGRASGPHPGSGGAAGPSSTAATGRAHRVGRGRWPGRPAGCLSAWYGVCFFARPSGCGRRGSGGGRRCPGPRCGRGTRVRHGAPGRRRAAVARRARPSGRGSRPCGVPPRSDARRPRSAAGPGRHRPARRAVGPRARGAGTGASPHASTHRGVKRQAPGGRVRAPVDSASEWSHPVRIVGGGPSGCGVSVTTPGGDGQQR